MSFVSKIIGTAPYEDLEKGYKAMQPGIQEATSKGVGYLSPYQQTGTGALGDYYSSLQGMADPQAYYNKIMSGYTESPAAKFQKEQGIQTLENQSQATGMGGSGQEMKDLLNYSQGLASQGQQDYLKNILGIQSGYLSGMGTVAGLGEQAGGSMAKTQMGGAEDIANMQEAEAKAKADKDAQEGKSLGGLIATGLGLFA